MGLDKEDGVSPGRLPGQGCKAANREASSPWEGWAVVLPVPGGSNEGGGFARIRKSILQRQNTVAQFIATRPILFLCEVAGKRPGTRVPRRWWEQTGIDWKAAREKAAAKGGDDKAEAAELELFGSDSEPEVDTPGGTAGGTGEEASLVASGSSGAEWSGVEKSGAGRRINLSGRDPKSMTK